MIDRKYFYDSVRQSLFGGKLSASQVEGMEAVLVEWEKEGLTDLRWLAYMLATFYHECGKTMQPIEEWGKGKGRPYGKKIKHSGVAYAMPDKIYYGRGAVQLTWFENYQLMGRLIGVDLLNNPEKALELPIAIKILFEGMLKGASSVGDFTGKCLEMYFNDTTEDWINARRIINSLDVANLIKGYGLKFRDALK